MLQNFEKHLN